MVTKAQKFRLGIFIFFASILLMVFLVMVAGKQIMQQWDTYYVTYSDTSVNGLQIGSSVKYYGIEIGRVENIEISSKDINKVVVEISVKKGTTIKADMTAKLVGVGITGLKQIELWGGSSQAKTLEPGSFIKPGVSALENITASAEVVAEKLEMVLTNIAKITNEENQIKFNRIISNTDSLINNNRVSFTNIMTNLDSTTFHMARLTKNTNIAISEFNNILESEQLYAILENADKITSGIAEVDLKKMLANLNDAIYNANEAFLHIDLTVLRGRSDLLNSLNVLKETLENLNDFSRQISEDPTLLLRPKK
ncbi:MAG: MlaD family protein [Candidatus Cloacimonadota bacterium]|nr:MlaD family protein [Candidatus Cloacimonadota bacterium]